MDATDPDQSQEFSILNPTPSEIESNQVPDNNDLQRNYEQRMMEFMRDLHINSNSNYSSLHRGYGSESDSDIQDQQPTEATDDAEVHPYQSRNDPAEITMQNTLHTQPHSADDVQSSLQGAEPAQENVVTLETDVQSICEEKPSSPSALVYKTSLCVPCTSEENKTEETKTTFTTIVIEEETKSKKDGNYLGHIMISYNHSTRDTCLRIAKTLTSLNYDVWIDEENICGDILTSMASAVENAYVVVMAINQGYYDSRYCRLEAEYSLERNKVTIPILMQSGFKAQGWLGMMNGLKYQIDFDQLSFDTAFNLLLREIEAVRAKLGAESTSASTITMRTQFSMTTMDSSSHSPPRVHTWCADDVIEWLFQEKLDIFQDALTNFNGLTLRQLYKLKSESVTDYYRMVESLLPASVPLRLFYNLSFTAALERLFSPSIEQ